MEKEAQGFQSKWSLSIPILETRPEDEDKAREALLSKQVVHNKRLEIASSSIFKNSNQTSLKSKLLQGQQKRVNAFASPTSAKPVNVNGMIAKRRVSEDPVRTKDSNEPKKSCLVDYPDSD